MTTPTFIATAAHHLGAGVQNPATLTYNNPLSAGDFLLVALMYDNTNGEQALAVTDDQGNHYTYVGYVPYNSPYMGSGNAVELDIYICNNTKANAGTTLISSGVTDSTSKGIVITALQYSGMTGYVQDTATSSPYSNEVLTSPCTIVNVFPSNANDVGFIIGCQWQSSAVIPNASSPANSVREQSHNSAGASHPGVIAICDSISFPFPAGTATMAGWNSTNSGLGMSVWLFTAGSTPRPNTTIAFANM